MRQFRIIVSHGDGSGGGGGGGDGDGGGTRVGRKTTLKKSSVLLPPPAGGADGAGGARGGAGFGSTPGSASGAEALHAHTATANDQISFAKGEALIILEATNNWWRVRNKSGKEGLAPSNFLAKKDGTIHVSQHASRPAHERSGTRTGRGNASGISTKRYYSTVSSDPT